MKCFLKLKFSYLCQFLTGLMVFWSFQTIQEEDCNVKIEEITQPQWWSHHIYVHGAKMLS